ncbi:MAG: putative sugar O-methyltransferase [Oligoflexia bacterium]|nr:putative sugar O-methyltransferase [Oligoflexia bacterium]
MTNLRDLHQEIVGHYKNCNTSNSNLSDTWAQTLKHWETNFSFTPMLEMLSPESKVNTWVDDNHYLIDRTVLDASDPIVKKLLSYGESDFGSPRKDIKLFGQVYSSGFIHHVLYAAKIITAIEAKNISEPTVMEIGGGLGGVVTLLRNYFNDKITLYIVDIPETLSFQEWSLRANFPAAKTSHKAGEDNVEFFKGGINFINAYVLESQPFKFDVAINIDSMQEMDRDIVAGYIRYIEKNISDDGFFYFENHFGHTSSPLIEPTECTLDGFWTINSAEIAYQIESCSESEQARFIFFRTREKENPETRRLVLRVLWNGFLSGFISNSPELVNELSGLPRRFSPDQAFNQIQGILVKHGLSVPLEFIENLNKSIFFTTKPFVEIYGQTKAKSLSEKSFTQRNVEAVWHVQNEMLQLMKLKAENEQNFSADKITQQLQSICEKHTLHLSNLHESEYWTAYISAIQMVLHNKESGRDLLMKCMKDSSSPTWLTRFAYLLSRFNFAKETEVVLSKTENASNEDYFLKLKRAEITALIGNSLNAKKIFQDLEKNCDADLTRCNSLAKTAVRAGEFDLVVSLCKKLFTISPDSCAALLLSIARTSSSKPDADEFRKTLINEFIELCAPKSDNYQALLTYGNLLLEVSRKDEALGFINDAITKSPIDYYTMARAGKLLQDARLDDFADKMLTKSLSLRPGAFLHSDFIGNIYFGAHRYQKAAECFKTSLTIKPYLRHLQAKYLYCEISKTTGDTAFFSAPSELSLIFQRKQDFYHDLGLSNKPTI